MCVLQALNLVSDTRILVVYPSYCQIDQHCRSDAKGFRKGSTLHHLQKSAGWQILSGSETTSSDRTFDPEHDSESPDSPSLASDMLDPELPGVSALKSSLWSKDTARGESQDPRRPGLEMLALAAMETQTERGLGRNGDIEAGDPAQVDDSHQGPSVRAAKSIHEATLGFEMAEPRDTDSSQGVNVRQTLKGISDSDPVARNEQQPPQSSQQIQDPSVSLYKR